eukprot:scaffold7799_cov94-Skeletonema_dohrnii-CCMP3373.AAC.3
MDSRASLVLSEVAGGDHYFMLGPQLPMPMPSPFIVRYYDDAVKGRTTLPKYLLALKKHHLQFFVCSTPFHVLDLPLKMPGNMVGTTQASRFEPVLHTSSRS